MSGWWRVLPNSARAAAAVTSPMVRPEGAQPSVVGRPSASLDDALARREVSRRADRAVRPRIE